MKRRARVRRVAKWAGVVVCVLIAGAWAANTRWLIAYGYNSPANWRVDVGLAHGAVGLALYDRALPGIWSGLVVFRRSPGAGFIWWPLDRSDGGLAYFAWYIPFWLLLGVCAMPTTWLWWRDRHRAGAGHCAACGYDLAGLAPGAACPECGKSAGLPTDCGGASVC